jgi:membrane associated rhomboid family serine protease
MPIRLTQAVKTLLIIQLVMFLVQHTGDQFLGTHLTAWLGLVPSMVRDHFAFWQLATYPFLHGDVMHLFFNMMMMAFIGSELEALWGSVGFLRYYFFCAVSSGIFYLILQLGILHGFGVSAPLLGPSGAIYGLLTAYGILFGERVLLFMMLFPMKAKHFVLVLALIELMTTFYSPGGAATGVALLGGMIGGFLYLWAQAKILSARRRSGSPGSLFGSGRAKKKKSKHLKLIVNNNRHLGSSDDSSDRGSGHSNQSNNPNDPKTWH